VKKTVAPRGGLSAPGGAASARRPRSRRRRRTYSHQRTSTLAAKRLPPSSSLQAWSRPLVRSRVPAASAPFGWWIGTKTKPIGIHGLPQVGVIAIETPWFATIKPLFNALTQIRRKRRAARFVETSGTNDLVRHGPGCAPGRQPISFCNARGRGLWTLCHSCGSQPRARFPHPGPVFGLGMDSPTSR